MLNTEETKRMKSVYVGNLPYAATADEIKELFEQYGKVQGVKLVIDREMNRPKGFGFVQMEDAGAAAAISALDGQQFGGRRLRVNEARERSERPPRQFDGPRPDRPPRRPAPEQDIQE